LLFVAGAASAMSDCHQLLRSLHGLTKAEFFEAAGLKPNEPLDKPLHIQIYDIDGNIAYLDASQVYMWDLNDEKEVPVSTQTYTELKDLAGKKGTAYEHLIFYDYLVYADGRRERISVERRYELSRHLGKPGPYQDVRLEEGSWRDFRDVPNPRIFKEAMQAALGESELHRWRATSWHSFARAMKDKQTAQWTGLLTTRGHDPQNILEGFDLLKQKGLIEELPRKEMIFPIYNPLDSLRDKDHR